MSGHDQIDPPYDPTAIEAVLDYLKRALPAYPFEPALDRPFVEELIYDFPGIDVLEELKTFRWYYDNAPLARVKNPRVAIRRWVARAHRDR